MWIQAQDGSFVNTYKAVMIAEGSNQPQEDIEKGIEFKADGICAWYANSTTRAHSLMKADKEADPLLFKWFTFNIEQAMKKQHKFFSAADVLAIWATDREGCIERMSQTQKAFIPAFVGTRGGEVQKPAPAVQKQDKALYGAVEQFMEEVGIDKSSPIWHHFQTKKAAGFDELAALLQPILNGLTHMRNDPFSFGTDPSEEHWNGTRLKSIFEAWDRLQLQIKAQKPDAQADEIVSMVDIEKLRQDIGETVVMVRTDDEEDTEPLESRAKRELAMA